MTTSALLQQVREYFPHLPHYGALVVATRDGQYYAVCEYLVACRDGDAPMALVLDWAISAALSDEAVGL